ncbi:M23 family metallopeptidase [Actinacidiphila yeochonensis]|uniref:M23 family metallopeptidase n=1 Tax=Actinacidiphila yeochonensis TaxID=89050 RepID=UPI000562DF34|nr:M23 family metallopeptidase [Actinacidiphila yeochonensis]
MPANGRNRKPRRLTRLYATAGVGTAAVVLPLLVGTAAHAATPAHTAAPAHSKPATYRVVKGDTLASIARAHHIKGGWKKLYAENKAVIGANPSVITPGEILTLRAPAHAAKAPAQKAAKPAARTTAIHAAKTAATTPVNTGWMKPVGDAAIGTGYKASGSLWSSGSHTGVDFLVNSGTPVHAVAAGTVVSAGADGAYGNDVILKHADGRYTLYGHLTTPLVSAGQTVTEGQEIGISGATGNVTGPHLHFEVRTTPYYGSDIDPVAYMAGHGVTI